MNVLPQKLLLRRGEVKAALGISRYEMRQLIECGQLHPIKLHKNAYAYFRQEDVLQIIEESKKEKVS